MFRLKHDPPVAEHERDGVAEPVRRSAPGQKFVLLATSGAAAFLILFGIASRNDYFGLLGASKAPHGEVQADARPVSVPEIPVPLTASEPPAPAYVTCPGGLRLPIGLDCPPAGGTAPPAAGAPSGESLAQRVRERRFKGVIASGSMAAGTQAGGAAAIGGNGAPPAYGAGAGASTGALGRSLEGTPTHGAAASLITNPSLTLAKGTLPDCTLLTAILSEQPGLLKCLLSAPVMSMDGKVVLMEAGTTMEGEYAAGVQAGQRTIFTLWTRAVTPNFVAVPLGSPGTDALGRAGTSGDVDSKWIERFAGAVIFSLFQDVKEFAVAREDARAAQRAASQGGGTYNIGAQGTLSRLGNSERTAQAIVQEMLRQGGQARPSLYKNQGEVIKIYVARDVDFSNVYELRSTGAPDRP